MKRNFTWTIVSCLVVIFVAVSLYVNKMTSEINLTNEQLKDLGFYLIEPPRNLGSFNLLDTNMKEFLPKDFNPDISTPKIFSSQYFYPDSDRVFIISFLDGKKSTDSGKYL